MTNPILIDLTKNPNDGESIVSLVLSETVNLHKVGFHCRPIDVFCDDWLFSMGFGDKWNVVKAGYKRNFYPENVHKIGSVAMGDDMVRRPVLIAVPDNLGVMNADLVQSEFAQLLVNNQNSLKGVTSLNDHLQNELRSIKSAIDFIVTGEFDEDKRVKLMELGDTFGQLLNKAQVSPFGGYKKKKEEKK